MNTIEYLKETYGYSTPIFLKDIRIGGKSKVSIRKDLSRAVENGTIIRKAQGVYCFRLEDEFNDGVTFEEIVELKYIKNDYGLPGLNLDIYGYYTGWTFLNQIGISEQVPAIVEITTNNTSCKRMFSIGNRKALLRKGKIAINRFNYKILQFLDAFYLLTEEDIKKNHDLLCEYISNNLSKADLEKYIPLYPIKIRKHILDNIL